MSILGKAEEIVNGERQATYGGAFGNHQRIANLWNAYGDGKYQSWQSINPVDVAIMMMLLKVARLEESPSHEDSYVDIAGYAEVAYRCVTKKDS